MLWRLPLGLAVVEDMRWLQPGRLLVGLREDGPDLPNLDYLLIDADSGRVLWRHARRDRQAVYDPIVGMGGVLLFRAQRGGERETRLIALDAATGLERWTRAFRGEVVRLHAMPAARMVVAEAADDRSVRLAAVAVPSGTVVWTRTLPAAPGGAEGDAVLARDQLLVFTTAGVERLSPETGRSVWSRVEVRPGASSPPPQSEGGEVLLVDAVGRLVALDTAAGTTRWSATLDPTVTQLNIYPDGKRVYVRGIRSAAMAAAAAVVGGGAHALAAVERGTGRTLWTQSGPQPGISNLVTVGGRLFFGTPTALVALDLGSGVELWRREVTTTGRLFPVRLRQVGDRLVYVSELAVAAYDTTGAQIYFQGVSPVSNEANLTGLDAAVGGLREAVALLQGAQVGTGMGAHGIALAEARRYQNMANTFANRSSEAFRQRRYFESELYNVQERVATTSSDQLNTLAFAISVIDVAGSFVRAMQIRRAARMLESTIERQELFRRSILTAYDRLEFADHVVRPTRRFTSASDDFVGVAVVELATGRRRETLLSPTYLSYGLWNLVDLESGIVYHHGIGLDPEAYQYGPKRRLYPWGEVRTLHSFLIAARLRVPN